MIANLWNLVGKQLGLFLAQKKLLVGRQLTKGIPFKDKPLESRISDERNGKTDYTEIGVANLGQIIWIYNG